MEAKLLIRRKLNNKSGFNLAETLVTVILLTIVLSAVTGGIEAARRAYKNVRLKSDAQMLLATTITEISTEFERARNLELGENNVISSYYSECRGGNAVLENGSDTKGIVISINSGVPVTLVTEGTRGIETLYTKFTSEASDSDEASSTNPNVPYFVEDPDVSAPHSISESEDAESNSEGGPGILVDSTDGSIDKGKSGYIRYTIEVCNHTGEGKDQVLKTETVCVRPVLWQ